ncbi:MAG: hypothetical protein OK455_11205 [Thaumarchaeota archaeon]|nr:hypothetical protein [Nitrososphaerota archaeon]
MLSSLALGVALATSVTTWLVLPFYFYRRARSRDRRGVLFSFATFAAISLPFFAANPEGFVYDVLLFQFGRPTPGLVTQAGTWISLNPSLSGLLVTMTGQQAPLYLRAAIVLVVLSLCLLMQTSVKGKVEESSGKGSLPASTLRASLFVAAAVLVLPSVFFFVYAELPLVLILSWLALRGGPDVATVR